MSEQSGAGAPAGGLVPQEGVDEGSAATTGEGPHEPVGDGVLGPGTPALPTARRTAPARSTWRRGSPGRPATRGAPGSSWPRARGERTSRPAHCPAARPTVGPVTDLATRLAALDGALRELDASLVAFSGGADSAFLLAAAVRGARAGPGGRRDRA